MICGSLIGAVKVDCTRVLVLKGVVQSNIWTHLYACKCAVTAQCPMCPQGHIPVSDDSRLAMPHGIPSRLPPAATRAVLILLHVLISRVCASRGPAGRGGGEGEGGKSVNPRKSDVTGAHVGLQRLYMHCIVCSIKRPSLCLSSSADEQLSMPCSRILSASVDRRAMESGTVCARR